MTQVFNTDVLHDAAQVVQQIIHQTLTLPYQGVVVGEAPAGAGKSFAVAQAANEAIKSGLRVVIATPTNEQAFSLIEELTQHVGLQQTIAFVHASRISLPDHIICTYPQVKQIPSLDADEYTLVVGTLNKLGDAFARQRLCTFDLLIIDEAFQANAVHYYGVGDLAPCHLLMGDRGQLAPFTTAPDGNRWRGLKEDPLLTAVDVILNNHSQRTHVFKFPITRRLDTRGAKVAQAFYPNHDFKAAVLEGVRQLTFTQDQDPHDLHDQILDQAASSGWSHVEQEGMPIALADPKTVVLIVNLVQRFFKRGPLISCEKHPQPRPVEQSDLAIAVSHNDQKNLLRVAFDQAGLDEVVINTANKLQGLTYQVVFAWHPLAGLTDVDAFHLDAGRLCVMLTRHRHACIVLGRSADRTLVGGIPPSEPVYVGWNAAPSLDGWYAHEAVFRHLEPSRIEWIDKT